jgi:hypothetical protein
MQINGNLVLNANGSGTINNAFIEQLAGGSGGTNLPTGVTGRIVYNTTENKYYYFNGTAWEPFSVGSSSVTSFQTSLSGLTPTTATTGAVTLAGTLGAASGGTGVNNGSSTMTFGGNVNLGSNALTFTTTGPTSVTLPTSGTLLSTTTGNYVSSVAGTPSEILVNGATAAATGAVTLSFPTNVTFPGSVALVSPNALQLPSGAGIELLGFFYDGASSSGTTGQALTSTGSATAWANIVNSITAGTGISISGGSGSSPYTGAIRIASTATTSSVLGTANQIDASTAAGVTTLSLDSALVAPGSVTVTTNLTVHGLTYESATTNIAAAGTNQGGATVLTTSYNVVTTSTATIAPFNGVELPASGVGLEITVVNASTNSIYVYPAGGDVIDSEQTGTHTFVVLPAGGTATYQSVNSGVWYTIDPVITISGAGLGLAYSPGTTTLSNTGVTSFSTGSTGLSVATSTGAVTLAGTLSVGSGGTGDTTFTTNGVLYGNGTGAIQATTAGANGYVLTSASGVPTWAAVSSLGVTSVTGTSNEITASTSSGVVTLSTPTTFIAPGSIASTTSLTAGTTLTVTGNTANSFLYSGTGGLVTSTVATNGQVLIGSTGATPVAATLTGTSGQIGVTSGPGSITLTNLGVLSITSASTSSSLAVTTNTAATGAVTIDVALNATLQNFGQLNSTGLIVQTAPSTFTDVSIVSGSTSTITVTNGSGVGGNPTIDLTAITQGNSGTFQKFTVNGYGQVIDTTAVTQGDLTGLLGTYYLPETGGTMSGNITFDGTHTVTGLPTPSGSTDAVPKSYVDSLVNGLSWKNPVAAAYTTGGALTLSGLQTIDGYTTVAGDRVLVIDSADITSGNAGIYVAASGAWTRSTDATTYSELQDAAVYVINGTTNGGHGYVQTGDLTAFTGQVWSQFTTAGSYIAGTGLTLTGSTFSITNVGTAGTYGSASSVPVFTTNAQGQVTAVTPTSISINGNQITSGTVGTAFGGTGVNGSSAANGTLLIGNGSGFTLATITGSTGLTVTNGSGTIALTNTGVTSNVAGTGISVSGATGAVTIANTGVLTNSFNTVTSADAAVLTVTPTAATAGAVAETITFNTQAPHLVFAGPGTGATAAQPTFRALVAGDISTVAVNSISFSGTGLTPNTATSGVVNVAGVLNLASGGTNANLTAVAGAVVYSTASAMAFTAAGTTGQVLTSNGTSAPTWSSLSSLGVTSITGTANQITASSPTGAVTLSLPSTVVLPGTLEVTSTSKFDALTYETTANVTATGSYPSLTAAFNVVTTTGASQGVTLPVPAYAGAEISIVNVGSNQISVFPNTGGTIDSATSITIPAGGTWTGQASTTTAWYSIDPVVVNSTGITVTYSPGQITIMNTGVLSLSGGSTGLTPTTGTSGNVTLGGVLAPGYGGTGVANNAASTLTISGAFGTTLTVTGTTSVTLPTSGTLLSSTTASGNYVSSIAAGTGISVSGATGAVTVNNTGVTSVAVSGGTTGLTTSGGPVTTTGTITLAGTLNVANGGTGLTSAGTAGKVLASTGSAFAATPIQFVYSSALHDSGTPATSYTVTHNLNQRFVNVTVYDSTYNQIIPNSVVLTDANTVTVTVNTAIDLYVVVMGVTGVAAA